MDESAQSFAELIEDIDVKSSPSKVKIVLKEVEDMVKDWEKSSKLFDRLLVFLYRIVFVHFIPLFDDEERDCFYSIISTCPLDLVLLHALKCENVDLTLQILKFVENLGFEPFFIENGCKLPPQTTCDLLISIPDKVSNLCFHNDRDIPRNLQPAVFYSIVFSSMEKTILSKPSMISKPFVSRLISRLAMQSYAGPIAKLILRILDTRASETIIEIITNTSPQCIPNLIKALVLSSASSKHLKQMFAKSLKDPSDRISDPTARSLTFEVLCGSVLTSEQSQAVVDLLFESSGRFESTFTDLSFVWNDVSFMHSASIPHQKSLGVILCMFLLKMENSTMITEGIQIRLESNDKELQTLAMQVAKALSSQMLPDYKFEGETLDPVEIPSENESEDSIDEDPNDPWEDCSEDSPSYLEVLDRVQMTSSRKKGIKTPIYPLEILEYLRKGRKDGEDYAYCEKALERLVSDENMLTFDTPTLEDIIDQLLFINGSKDSVETAMRKLTFEYFGDIHVFLCNKLTSRSLTTSDKLLLLRIIRDTSISLCSHKSKGSPNLFYGHGASLYNALENNFISLNAPLRDPALIAQYISTLAVVLECCKVSHTQSAQMQSILSSLWTLCIHLTGNREILIRRSVLFAFAKIFTISSSEIIQSRFTNGILHATQWLLLMSKDGDKVCRQMASVCLEQMQSKLPKLVLQ